MAHISEVGSFYAGGQLHTRTGFDVETHDLGTTLTGFRYDPNGTYAVESCYVQYFLPAQVKGLPIVLIHGGALTGAMWETTPCGRKGWVQLLLERGRPVYVIDGVERGRAGFIPFSDVWPDEPILRSAEETWWLYRFGNPEDFARRKLYEGHKFPIDAFEQLLRLAVPRWRSTTEAAKAAYREALRKIGPAIIFAHSSGGVFGLNLAQNEPELVRAVVGIEPSTFPDGGQYPAGLPFVTFMGDFLDRTEFWRNLMPVIEKQIADSAEAGANAACIHLSDLGLPGHSHMYMMDEGNEQVLDAILNDVDLRVAAYG